MPISKTKIGNRLHRKKNQEVVDTLLSAKKNQKWMIVAQRISSSRKKYLGLNLSEINAKCKDGDKVIVVGKVLGNGELTKKIKICAFGFSTLALEKMNANNIEHSSILDEINKNPKAEGIKLL